MVLRNLIKHAFQTYLSHLSITFVYNIRVSQRSHWKILIIDQVICRKLSNSAPAIIIGHMEHSANNSGILSNFKRKGTSSYKKSTYLLSFEKFGENKEIFEWAWPPCTHRRSLWPWVGNPLKHFVMGPFIAVSCYLKKVFTKNLRAKSKLAISSRKPSVTANFSAKICYNLPYTYSTVKKLSE